jgi:hypothetical protein
LLPKVVWESVDDRGTDGLDPGATRRRADLIAKLEAMDVASNAASGDDATEVLATESDSDSDVAIDDVDPPTEMLTNVAPPVRMDSASRACLSCKADIPVSSAYCPRCGASVRTTTRVRTSIRAATVGALVTGLVVAVVAFAAGAATNEDQPSSLDELAPSVTSGEVSVTTTPYVPSTTSIITDQSGPLEAGSAGGYVLSATDDSGYTSTVTLSVDQPVRVGAASSTSLARKVKACSADPITDAIVPVRVQVENTTKKFPSVLGVDLQVSSSALDVASDVQYSTGPVCNSPSNSTTNRVFGLEFNDPIGPGASASSDFFLVLHNYYSPSLPSGDVTDYGDLTLMPVLTFGDTDTDGARRETPTVVRMPGLSGPIFQISGAPSVLGPTTPTSNATPRTGSSSYTLGAELNLRNGPGTNFQTLGLVPEGSSVIVQCTTTGESVDGLHGADDRWNRISYQGQTGYVANGFVSTGTDIADRSKIPIC